MLCFYQQSMVRHVTPTSYIVDNGNKSVTSTVSETSREAAARLLFACVHWARSVPALLRLPVSDQRELITNSWSELFLLTAAQFDVTFQTIQRYSGHGDHAILRHDVTSSKAGMSETDSGNSIAF